MNTVSEQPEAGRDLAAHIAEAIEKERFEIAIVDLYRKALEEVIRDALKVFRPQVQEAGRDECQRCEGYGEIPIEDLDVPCGACKGTGKAVPPATAEAVRLLKAIVEVADDVGEKHGRVRELDALLEQAEQFLAQHGGRG